MGGGGAGTQRAPPKPHLLKKVVGIDPRTRADHGKAHVIISERRDKKAAKFTVKDLPYPYTSKAQFERGMETAMGSEWNTRVGFQRATLPKVVMKVRVHINCKGLFSQLFTTDGDCHRTAGAPVLNGVCPWPVGRSDETSVRFSRLWLGTYDMARIAECHSGHWDLRRNRSNSPFPPSATVEQ